MSARFARAVNLIVFVWVAALALAAEERGQAPPHSQKNASTEAATQAPGPAGLESPWDVRNILAALVKDNEQLRSLIVQLNPQQWYDQKGAPTTYIPQWTTAQRQVNDVVIASRLLSQNTESLSQALDTYFRLEALETSARSLDEGARKYADRASADKLGQLIARNFSNRERFRDYLRDLASSKEQDFKIADAEAQRCRGMISKEAPAGARTKRQRD
ncbi:MAG: hypothetical protein ACR2JB_09060 [Bryobacteraceae bacterium]